MLERAPGPIFDKSLLSSREYAVLKLAASGRTDEQIAQELGVSTSTVNSYWGRVRGKMGSGSRTELVGAMLRHDFQEALDLLRQENQRLRQEYDELLAQSEDTERLAMLRGDVSWHALALDWAPEALLVVQAPGTVVFANLCAQRMLQLRTDELGKQLIWNLFALHQQMRYRRTFEQYFESAMPGRRQLGLDYPIFLRRADHSLFRASVSVESFESATGPMAICSIRQFLEEIDDKRRAISSLAAVTMAAGMRTTPNQAN